MKRHRQWIAVVVLCIAGCLVPEPPDGAIKCHSGDNACPDNYTCVQGVCSHAGTTLSDAGAATCNDYCNCVVAACAESPGGFQSKAGCLIACAKLMDTALQCRTYHCGLAMVDPTMHCPHALGQSTCM
jgi:hypothetical protein